MTQSPIAPSEGTAQHTRITDSLLGKAEKKALHWLAARMPAWVTPDTLTMLGLAASVLIFLGYALTFFDRAFLWLSSFGFLLNWFGDSLDGTLARYRKIERPRYGFFVDHIIDTISEALIFIGLGISPFLRFDLALLALIVYLMLSTYVYLATYVNGIFRISYARLGPTEARLVCIGANTIVFFTGTAALRLPLGSREVLLTAYDVVAVVFIALAAVIFFYNAINTAMQLSREDRLAAQARRRTDREARRADRAARRAEKTARRTYAPRSSRTASTNVSVSKLSPFKPPLYQAAAAGFEQKGGLNEPKPDPDQNARPAAAGAGRPADLYEPKQPAKPTAAVPDD